MLGLKACLDLDAGVEHFSFHYLMFVGQENCHGYNYDRSQRTGCDVDSCKFDSQIFVVKDSTA